MTNKHVDSVSFSSSAEHYKPGEKKIRPTTFFVR